MPGFLKLSTASQVVELGPFLDDTDFKTVETGLTIANTDIKLRKHGGTTHVSKNSGGGTHIANGYYYATLDATDTDTLGIIDLHVNVAGALPVFDRFMVMAANVYDAFVRGMGAYPVRTGTAQAGAAGSITLDASASAVSDFYEGTQVTITAGTGIGQTRAITSYNGSTKVASIAPNWATTPDNTSIFAVLPMGQLTGITGTVGFIGSGGISRTSFAADTGLQTIRSGTAQAGAAGTITLDSSASALTDFYEAALVLITGGTGVGQARVVTSYNGTTKVASIAPNWRTTPDNTSTFAIIASGYTTHVTGTVDLAAGGITAATIAAAALNGKGDWLTAAAYTPPPTAGQVADQVWEETTTDHPNAGTKGGDSLLSDAFVDQPVSSLPVATSVEVWGYSSRTLTAFGTLVADIWNYAVTSITTAGSIGKRIVDNLNATISSVAAAVWDLPTTGHTTVGTFGNNAIAANGNAANAYTAASTLSDRLEMLVLLKGQVSDADVSTPTIVYIGGNINPAVTFGTDELVDLLVVVRDGSTLEYHARWIVDFDQSTKALTLDSALPFTPDQLTGDTYSILPARKDPNVSAVKTQTDLLPVDKLVKHSLAVLAVVVGNGSTTTTVKLSTVDGAAPSATNDFYNGAVLAFTSGALAGQRTLIEDYDGATTTATVVALTSAPVNAVTAVIV
jgi:hypothetical protein